MAINDPAVMKAAPDAAPSFPIISKQISTFEGDDGRRRFRLTASSTIEDRTGDEITRDALEKATQAFRDGITIYTDHDFKNVNKAFGLTDKAEVVQRGMDSKTGKPIFDLDVEGVVNVPNPNAVQLADSIDGGYAKFGASITAFVRKHAKKSNGGMFITEIEPIEASLVGVPDNQRSWAHRAALAVKSFHKPDWLLEEEKLMSKDAEIETPEPLEAPTEPDAPEAEEVPGEHETAPAEEPVEKAASTDDTDTCPGCGKTRDAEGCDNGFHSVEKSIDESTLGVQESAPADAVETPETAPDVADNAAAEAIVAKSIDGVTDDEVKELLGHVTRMATQIGALLEENAALKQANADLTAAKGSIADEVEQARTVISKVLDMPLRSQTAGYVGEFVAGHTMFAPEVQDFLNKRSKLSHE